MSKHNLHTHSDMEDKLGVPDDHVIIDIDEYHKAHAAIRELDVLKAGSSREATATATNGRLVNH